MMNKKNLLSILGVLVIIIAIAFAYQYLPRPTPQSSLAPDAPVITGGLVGISTTTITVKAADGTQMTFEGSAKTPVMSRVKEGEVGRTYAQLSIGDVLAVTASRGARVVQKIEIIPIADSPSAAAKADVISTGALVSMSSSTIVVKPFTNDPVLQNTNTNVTFQINKNTEMLMQVLGGQTAKPLSSVAPGAPVKIAGISGGRELIAKEIVFLLVH